MHPFHTCPVRLHTVDMHVKKKNETKHNPNIFSSNGTNKDQREFRLKGIFFFFFLIQTRARHPLPDLLFVVI